MAIFCGEYPGRAGSRRSEVQRIGGRSRGAEKAKPISHRGHRERQKLLSADYGDYGDLPALPGRA